LGAYGTCMRLAPHYRVNPRRCYIAGRLRIVRHAIEEGEKVRLQPQIWILFEVCAPVPDGIS